jgi:hypothetical protein
LAKRSHQLVLLRLAVDSDFYENLPRDDAAGVKTPQDSWSQLYFTASHHVQRIMVDWHMLAFAMTP